ncbi:hypothetical protein [Ferviditalea candida]|uniref:hypothetical protein n=1 Tax=Ferviditalea candida TaxID=3108399 RepID=UPI00352CCA4D
MQHPEFIFLAEKINSYHPQSLLAHSRQATLHRKPIRVKAAWLAFAGSYPKP